MMFAAASILIIACVIVAVIPCSHKPAKRPQRSHHARKVTEREKAKKRTERESRRKAEDSLKTPPERGDANERTAPECPSLGDDKDPLLNPYEKASLIGKEKTKKAEIGGSLESVVPVKRVAKRQIQGTVAPAKRHDYITLTNATSDFDKTLSCQNQPDEEPPKKEEKKISKTSTSNEAKGSKEKEGNKDRGSNER